MLDISGEALGAAPPPVPPPVPPGAAGASCTSATKASTVSIAGIGQFCPPPSWVSGSVLMLGVILVLGAFLVAMNELWAFPILAV